MQQRMTLREWRWCQKTRFLVQALTMADSTVRWFRSTMQGAPALTGLAGSLVGVLDACLLGGFGSLTLDGISVTSATAVATKSTGHAYLKGQMVEIGGATPTALNGLKRVVAVTATTFSFEAPGVANGSASGALTCRVPPIGTWTKPFSGTNKAAYRSLAVGGTNLYLRVDDSGSDATDLGRAARVRGYETMTDVDTGTGPFPTIAQVADPGPRWPKSDSTAGDSRPWMLVGNDRVIYLWIAPGGSLPNAHAFHYFGDLARFSAVDPYLCVLAAATGTAGGFAAYNQHFGRGNPMYYGQVAVARSYIGTGDSILPSPVTSTPPFGGASVGSGVLSNPCVVDGKSWITPLTLVETVSWVLNPRARYPGLYEPLHVAPSPWLDFTLVEDFDGMPRWMIGGCGVKGLSGSVYHEFVVDVDGGSW